MKQYDFSICEFIDEKMWFFTYYDFCDNRKQIKREFDKLTRQQKKFYTKLYKLLGQYEKKGVVGLNDNVILATIFFEIPLGYVVDDDGKNKDDYAKITNSSASSYNNDNENIDEYDVTTDDSEALSRGTDTLKLLIKSMVGYRASCYGISDKEYKGI